MQIEPIEIVLKKEEYLVSKWLTSSFLVDSEEFKNFISEMGDFFLYPTGRLVSCLNSISHKNWGENYLKNPEPLLMTYDPKDVYAFAARSEQYILYPRYPVIQVREHQFMWTSDDRIQTMVFGKDSIRWGLTFSYPQIFYDRREKKIVQVLKERDSPNTVGFKKLQKWVRDFTKPAQFIRNGKKINATFRIGKNSSHQTA